MLLSIKEMEVRKVRFDETFEPEQIDFTGANVRQATPLRAEGIAELLANTDGEVRIKGRMTVTMETDCDRCLGRALYPFDAPFDLFYRPSSLLPDVEEIAIDAGEAEIGFYEGAGLELEDILREQVMLLLPMQRVCSEACQGICAVCGRNRNESSCHCTQTPGDDRWSALRNL